MARALTQRDEEILDTLSRRVRLLVLSQIATHWWKSTSSSKANAQARIRTLEQAGWVSSHVVMAHPILQMEGPLFSWSPGKTFPPYRSLSYQLVRRWNQEPIRMKTYIATSKSGHHFGGRGGKLPRNHELSHDIHLAQVFLSKWKGHGKGQGMDPELWESEELFHAQERNLKRPDAFIRPNTAIEMGGQYGVDKLKTFHALCEENRWDYEIW